MGPPLLMLAGAGGRGTAFLPLASRWKAQYRCLMPDPTPPYAAEEAAEIMLRQLTAAGIDTFHVLGVSLGGCMAQQVAVQAPDHVLSLTLSATFVRMDDATYARVNALRDARLTLPGDAFLLKWFSLLFGDAPWPRGATAPPRDTFAAQTEAALAYDGTATVPGIRCPTCVTYGTDDALIPPALSIALAQAIPGATAQPYPGGHMHWQALSAP